MTQIALFWPIPHATWLKYFNLNYYWDGRKFQMNSVQNTILDTLFQNTRAGPATWIQIIHKNHLIFLE
jgi:hypothetical protein